MPDVFNTVLIWGFIFGSIYLGLTLGFSIVAGVLRVFHMGFGLFFTASIYFVWTFWKVLGFNIWLSIFLAVLASIFLSLALYPLIKKYLDIEDYLLISLVLVFLIGEEVINHIYPVEVGVYLPTLIFSESMYIGGIVIVAQYLFLSFLSLLIFLFYVLMLKYTKYGLIMRAVSQDLNVARLFGINVSLTYTLSLGLAVVAPSLIIIFYSPLTRVDPFMGFPLFVVALQVAVLGGLGNLKGTLLASYITGYIHATVGFLIDPRAMNLASLIATIIILLIRPQGLARAESIW